MRHNKYICENPVTVEVSGDTYTFTLVDCRYTSPQVIQNVLNSFAKSYLCEQGLYALAPKTKCGNLLLTTSGKVATINVPGVGWWKRSIAPKTSEKIATLFMSPWKQSINDSVPRFIFTSTNGDGYAIRIKDDGLNGIFEGDSFGAWYGPKDADRTSGISGKTIFADYEYYNYKFNLDS